MNAIAKGYWLDMPPGPELNELIARRAGLKVLHGTAVFWNADGKREYTHVYYETPDGKAHPLPDYTGDLNAAFSLFLLCQFMEWNVFSDSNNDTTAEIGEWGGDEPPTPLFATGNAKERNFRVQVCMACCRAFLDYSDRTNRSPLDYMQATTPYPGSEVLSASSAKLAEIVRLQKESDRLAKENAELRLSMEAARRYVDVDPLRVENVRLKERIASLERQLAACMEQVDPFGGDDGKEDAAC